MNVEEKERDMEDGFVINVEKKRTPPHHDFLWNFKMKEDRIKKQIAKICNKVWKLSPKETISNSMTTRNHQKPIFKILWRPNNYRRKIRVKIKDNSTIEKIRSAIQRANINNHTKLVSIKNYKGITIQYGRNTLIGILSQEIIYGSKETILIEAYSIKDLDERLIQKREERKEKIDKALFDFIKEFNIGIRFEKPKWDRYEDWIKGEDYIDKIPRECIIHDTYFKKVYPKGIEFKSSKNQKEPIVLMKNYIKNRAIEDIAPEIAKQFKYVRSKMYRDHKVIKDLAFLNIQFNQNLALYNKNIVLHLSVLKEIKKGIKRLGDSK